MTPVYQWLSPQQAPLAGRFYASEGDKSSVRRDERIAVARLEGRIVAALRLSPREGHTLLRALRVAQSHRGQGLARGLLRFALTDSNAPIWCFALADLTPFYLTLGFIERSTAPAAILGPFQAYAQRQPLRLMCFAATEGSAN
ncbi:GNAT family N-acetyltransferase [Ferrimonas pelagia]|uniref:N-acetyltransferase domain-containing protein n=1 Tax=Ferrimonas pelagia TaxID=1177826 RepID=A0ABP9FE85_9GAMM